MDAGTLGTEIAKVCPVQRVTMGKPDDRATWSYEAKEGATAQQIADGDNVIATIPYDFVPEPEVPIEDQVLYDHENRLRTLEGTPPLDATAFLAKRPKRPRPTGRG